MARPRGSKNKPRAEAPVEAQTGEMVATLQGPTVADNEAKQLRPIISCRIDDDTGRKMWDVRHVCNGRLIDACLGSEESAIAYAKSLTEAD